MATLELDLLNWRAEGDAGSGGDAGYAFEDESDLRLGADIEVLAALVAGQTESIFKGRVHALEGVFGDSEPPRLIVLAEDKTADLRLKRRSARYQNMSAGDCGSADRLGQRPERQHRPGLRRQSRLAATGRDRSGLRAPLVCHAWQAPATHVQRPGIEDGAQAGGSAPTVSLDCSGSLINTRVLADLAHQRTGVRVTGFDLRSGAAIDETVTQPSTLPGSGRSGPELLRRAIGDRIEPLSHRAGWSATEARALAQQALDDRARRFLRLRSTALNEPRLHCGVMVDSHGRRAALFAALRGVPCRASLDTALGFRTEFEAFGAYLGNLHRKAGTWIAHPGFFPRSPPPGALHLGRVTSVQDPESQAASRSSC